jgi:hypothetical protein
MLAGCGSAASSNYSVAGLKAAAHEFVDDLGESHYAMACEVLSAKERAELAAWPKGGCAGLLHFADVFARIGSHRGLGEVFQSQSGAAVQEFRIRGKVAIYQGHIAARYEHGRWRLEHNGDEALVELTRLKAEIERARISLEESGGSLNEVWATGSTK